MYKEKLTMLHPHMTELIDNSSVTHLFENIYNATNESFHIGRELQRIKQLKDEKLQSLLQNTINHRIKKEMEYEDEVEESVTTVFTNPYIKTILVSFNRLLTINYEMGTNYYIKDVKEFDAKLEELESKYNYEWSIIKDTVKEYFMGEVKDEQSN